MFQFPLVGVGGKRRSSGCACVYPEKGDHERSREDLDVGTRTFNFQNKGVEDKPHVKKGSLITEPQASSPPRPCSVPAPCAPSMIRSCGDVSVLGIGVHLTP